MKTMTIQYIISDMNSVKNLSKLPFQFSVTFAPTVKSIPRNSFCKIKQLLSVTIPSSITDIGIGSFSDCISLKQVIFETPSNLRTIQGSVFQKCSLEEIEIPPSVTSIGGAAFKENKLLKTVTIPSSVIEYQFHFQ